MYDKSLAAISMSGAAVSMSGTVGTLTRIGAEFMWVFLGGFALIAAGLAVLRTLPRKQA